MARGDHICRSAQYWHRRRRGRRSGSARIDGQHADGTVAPVRLRVVRPAWVGTAVLLSRRVRVIIVWPVVVGRALFVRGGKNRVVVVRRGKVLGVFNRVMSDTPRKTGHLKLADMKLTNLFRHKKSWPKVLLRYQYQGLQCDVSRETPHPRCRLVS